jgi:hypothetical protein
VGLGATKERSLKNALGFSRHPCAIVTSALIFKETGYRELLEIGDVFAVSRALRICERVGSLPTLVPFTSIEDLAENQILIGGWFTNQATNSVLQSFCPGFQIIKKVDENDAGKSLFGDHRICGLYSLRLGPYGSWHERGNVFPR